MPISLLTIFKLFFGKNQISSPRWMLVSWIGGFLGNFLIEQLGRLVKFGDAVSLFLIGSFGSSAVLAYGAPQASFSPPRNIIGDHCISALVGVSV